MRINLLGGEVNVIQKDSGVSIGSLGYGMFVAGWESAFNANDLPSTFGGGHACALYRFGYYDGTSKSSIIIDLETGSHYCKRTDNVAWCQM